MLEDLLLGFIVIFSAIFIVFVLLAEWMLPDDRDE